MIAGLVVYFLLILVRVAAFVAVMPLFAGSSTPRLVRTGLATALAVFWFGRLAPPADLGALAGANAESWLLFLTVMAREAVLGAMVGLIFALFLAPVRIAGEFAAEQVGLAQSVVLGPAADHSGGPLTLIFETLGGLLFLGLNGHHIVIAVLHASFARFPLGGTTLTIPTEGLVAGVTTAESLGLLLAGPLALSLFLVTVILALMARVAPQLNIFSVGFTIQATVALIATYVLLPDLLGTLTNFFGQVSDFVGQILG